MNRESSRTVGVIVTWVGGGISVVLLCAVSLVSLLAWYVVGNGIDVGSGRFACRDQACLDLWTSVLAVGVSTAALVLVLIVLAVRSSTGSLLAAAVIGGAVAVALLGLMLITRPGSERYGIAWLLLFFAAGPAPIALGSALRLWARRPPTDGRTPWGRSN